MAALFNTHLVTADAATMLAAFGMRLRTPSQGTAAGANDHALARRCAH
jgi:hypothetical protein